MLMLKDSYFLHIVDCRGVALLGGLFPGYPWEVPLRLRLKGLFYSLKVPLKLKIKNTRLILLLHFILSHFAQMRYAAAKCQICCVTKNGDKVSKNDESCHICNKWLKSCFSELWKMWDSVYTFSNDIGSLTQWITKIYNA